MSDSSLETTASLSPQEKRELLGRLLKQRAKAAANGTPRPAPLAASGELFEPFPLRDIQQAYWIGRGRDFELGNVGAYVYIEFDLIRLDVERLGAALNALIRRHAMMRAVILPSGQQRILPDVPPYELPVLDLSAEASDAVTARLAALRAQLSHALLPTDRWPLFDIRLTILPQQQIRIHAGIDLLIADLRSIQILIGEWFQLYLDLDAPQPALGTSFRDYVLAERAQEGTPAFARAEAYWRRRIEDLPPAPELPLAKAPATILSPRFSRRTARFPPHLWALLKEQAERHHVTPSSVLLAAFGWVLASWSRSPRLTVDVTIFNRLPLYPDVNGLVGDFTSVIFAAIDHTKRESFSDRCARINKELWEALDHREFSGVRVLRELLRKSGGPGHALMPVVFTCDLRHDVHSIKDSASEVLPGELVYGVSQTPQVYLDHQVFEERGGLIINWDSVEELFPEGLLQDMFDANMRLLQELARDERWWLDRDGSLTPESHRRVVSAANATDGAVSTDLLHEGFARQVQRDPDRVAIVCTGRTITYGELFERASHLAGILRESGARPDSLVAVVMEKGWEQVAAVLGILQTGSAYLPIDPELPPERFHYLLQHGRISVALTQSRVDGSLDWPSGIERRCVDDRGLNGGAEPLMPVRRPEDIAYVIYTSGSTGLPKGVVIDHRGAVNTVLGVNERFSVGPGDRVLALSSLSFDLSVYDIFGTLSAGATIVVPDASVGADPAQWLEIIRRERITIWNSVPAMMELLVDYVENRKDRTLDSLRLVMLSGDWIPVTLPDRIKALAEGVAIVSLGGATEASIWSILYPIDETDPGWESIPYGRPMRNQRFYVLDEQLDQRPLGVAGELYIGGIGLAKGYWRDEDKTAARFIVHPGTGERLYRTGDWGAYLPDGNIRFLGRQDSQVKIQGYRVELGEIEAALLQHPGVRSAVVTAVGDPRGAKRLLAHVVCQAEPGPTDLELKEYLRGKLPAYMVPSGIVKLDALPLTANGKVDRRALPSPPSPVGGGSDDATTAVARRLTALITDALHIDSLDQNASLTDLGANSLDLLRIGNLLETEFGFRPTMQEFLRVPSIAGLAAYYGQRLAAQGSDARPAPPLTGADSGSGWQSFRLLVDPGERAAFKARQPGLRNVDGCEFFALPAPVVDRAPDMFERRSQRTFERQPIPLAQFSAFLSRLRQLVPGRTKRQYASAGGLYPVQTCLHVKEDRVDGVRGGTYYYDPAHHRLVPLARDAVLDRNIHWSENRAIFDEAAFSVFFVARMSAIAPLYQERSLHFATIEAGLMSQLLEMAAPGCGLGLCHIGDVNFEPVRRLFALDDSDVLVHSLLGGRVDRARDSTGDESEDPTIARAASIGTPSLVPAALDVGGLTSINVSALKPDVVLAPEIRFDGPASVTNTPSRILLTGATGFLGAFLLRGLLDRTDADIHCLVRASNADDGLAKLRRNLDRHGLWNDRAAARIVPVPGDLAEPRVGLNQAAFDELASGIDAIYHNAAFVNLVRPYDALKAINVGGTHEILRLASRGRGTPLHFVSSVAVFPFEGGRIRGEQDSLDHGENLTGGYAQSKWVAEQLVALARSRGLRACIYRPGTISGDSRTGAFSDDSYLDNLIRGCVELGSAPDIDVPVDLVPVDFVAAAIVSLSQQQESIGNVFHLTNPRPASMSALIDFMNASGYRVRRVSYQTWKQELLSLGQRFERNALYPFGGFIARLDEGTAMGPRYDCTATLAGLAGTPVACPAADDALLRVYFARYVNSGFLRPPQP